MTKKYVLTEKAKEYIRSVVKSPERAEEIISKAETVFNTEQLSAFFTLGELKINGMRWASANIYLERHNCSREIEDWELSDEEIDSIGAQEKKDNE